MKKFKTGRFLKLILFISSLTAFTFIVAFARDESGPTDNFIFNFLADSFYIFRFPTHVLFWSYMTGYIFFIGLLLNAILYALIIELLISNLIIGNKKGAVKTTP